MIVYLYATCLTYTGLQFFYHRLKFLRQSIYLFELAMSGSHCTRYFR